MSIPSLAKMHHQYGFSFQKLYLTDFVKLPGKRPHLWIWSASHIAGILMDSGLLITEHGSVLFCRISCSICLSATGMVGIKMLYACFNKCYLSLWRASIWGNVSFSVGWLWSALVPEGGWQPFQCNRRLTQLKACAFYLKHHFCLLSGRKNTHFLACYPVDTQRDFIYVDNSDYTAWFASWQRLCCSSWLTKGLVLCIFVLLA